MAALRATEPGHAAALRRCSGLFAGRDQIVVPAIFDVEVTSALVRRGIPPERVLAFFDRHLPSRRLITLGPRAVRTAATVAATTRLRAADAFYVWVAARENLPLVTSDEEVLTRAPLAGARVVAP